MIFGLPKKTVQSTIWEKNRFKKKYYYVLKLNPRIRVKKSDERTGEVQISKL